MHDSHNSSLSTFDSKGLAGCSKSPCLQGMNGFSVRWVSALKVTVLNISLCGILCAKLY